MGISRIVCVSVGGVLRMDDIKELEQLLDDTLALSTQIPQELLLERMRVVIDKAKRQHTLSHTLANRVTQLTIILQVYDEVSSTLNVDHVTMITLDASLRLSGATAGFIALKTPQNQLTMTQMIGDYPSFDLDLGQASASLKAILETRHTQLLNDSAILPELPRLSNAPVRLLLPLITQDEFIGLLVLDTARADRFNPSVQQLLEILRGYLAIALANASLHERVNAQYSELKRVHERVSALEQLKTDMIRLASHDLRNPLNVLMGYVQMIDDTPTQHDYIQSMMEAIYKMDNIINGILSLERIEQMGVTGLSEIVDLGVQLRLVLKEYRSQAEKQKVSLVLQCDASKAYVTGDSAQLLEAMGNLIGNAIKYTPTGGQVVITLKRTSEHYEFTVADTGLGIDSEYHTRLFQPFFRVRTDETRKIKGTGLGLHLVKNIITRHNGEIIFNSEVGKGSVFGFRLIAV